VAWPVKVAVVPSQTVVLVGSVMHTGAAAAEAMPN
jgi:hypothetical protein